ncbi:hypothetical protein B0H11DRAFT_1904843 [Mycena galericulata]|nr:hypothetical protein B0H11DRAFT_1904843 [Mycena galericulata]
MDHEISGVIPLALQCIFEHVGSSLIPFGVLEGVELVCGRFATVCACHYSRTRDPGAAVALSNGGRPSSVAPLGKPIVIGSSPLGPLDIWDLPTGRAVSRLLFTFPLSTFTRCSDPLCETAAEDSAEELRAVGKLVESIQRRGTLGSDRLPGSGTSTLLPVAHFLSLWTYPGLFLTGFIISTIVRIQPLFVAASGAWANSRDELVHS